MRSVLEAIQVSPLRKKYHNHQIWMLNSISPAEKKTKTMTTMYILMRRFIRIYTACLSALVLAETLLLE